MLNEIINAVNSYLDVFSNEGDRLSLLLEFLNNCSGDDVYDWNNVNGHVTVGAFIYCKSKDKFLVLYHKDLKMFLYPGGHIDSDDKDLLGAVHREVFEECGIDDLELFSLCCNGMPFDIDIHLIPDNPRVGMMRHYHYDFRYLYYVSDISDVKYDNDELSSYKWISSNELINDVNFGGTVKKVLEILSKEAF